MSDARARRATEVVGRLLARLLFAGFAFLILAADVAVMGWCYGSGDAGGLALATICAAIAGAMYLVALRMLICGPYRLHNPSEDKSD